MEEPMKKCSGQEKKKMAVKIGGGIGAVILLGGALVTAALASAFLVRKRGRSSGENRRRRTPSAELNNKNEQDEAETGLQFILLRTSSNQQNRPSVAREEVESDNYTPWLVSTQIFKQDKKVGSEIHGGTPGAVSHSETGNGFKHIFNSDISGRKLEKEAICDLLGEKLKFEPKNMMHQVKIQLSKEDVITNEIAKESSDFKQVHIEEEGFIYNNGESGTWGNQETILVVSSLSEDGQEAPVPVLERHDIKQESSRGKRVVLPPEILEIIEEDEAIEGNKEDYNIHFGKEERDFGSYDENVEVVYLPKEQENDVEKYMGTRTGDDLIGQTSEDEGSINDDDAADEDEGFLYDQVEESSLGTGDSSSEEVIWPALLLQESSMKPPRVKLTSQQLEGKTEEDKGTKEGKVDYQESAIATVKNYKTNSTTSKILILMLLVIISSVKCSRFFGSSFVKLCFIVFFTMILSKFRERYARHCSYRWRSSEQAGNITFPTPCFKEK